MPSDRTRTSQDLAQRYKAVVMQQGRVILDRDFNALQEIVDGLLSATALDAIGPWGAPGQGFEITVPPFGPSVSSAPSASTLQPDDFLISPGTIYVGGQRLVLPPPAPNQPKWSYYAQPPDWESLTQSQPFSGPAASSTREYVHLDVHEQEVGAVEDSDLLDVALGGPDTSQRARLMLRIHRTPVSATDPATALVEVAALYNAQGLHLDTTTMQFRQQVQLQVSFPSTPASSSPCDPVVQGGYLGADNQLIRIQLAQDPKSPAPQLLWGYDNASFLYRAPVPAASVNVQNSPGQTTLTLLQSPVDSYHAPQPGQVVEVLQAAAILENAPGPTVPAGQGNLLRCVAARTGYVTTVASYTSSNNTLVLNSTLPQEYTQSASSTETPLFLRVWQGKQSITPQQLPQTIQLTDSVTGLPLGIQVTLSVPSSAVAAGVLPIGAFWMIAVRPGTPQAVYPEDFLTQPQWPDGPRNWICPLALINWLGQGSFSAPALPADCRNQFASLFELTARAWEAGVNVIGASTVGPASKLISDGTLVALSDLQQGLQIILDQNIATDSATEEVCFVTLDLPYSPNNSTVYIGYQRVVVAASVSTMNASTIIWSPSLTFWSNLNKVVNGLSLGSFDTDWTVLSPAQLPGGLSWSYTKEGHAELNGTLSPSNFTTTTAISSQLVDSSETVTNLTAEVSSAAAGSGTVGVQTGLVFNFANGNYWLFGLSPLPAAKGTTPAAVLVPFTSTGQGQQLTFQLPPLTDNVQDVGFTITQSSGGTPLSFALTILGNLVPVNFIPTTATKLPTSITPGTNVGLAVSFQVASGTPSLSLDFSRLTIGYGGVSGVILPADFRLQLNLTVKRSYLQPVTSTGNSAQFSGPIYPAPPDYSVSFWLVPPGFYGQSPHGSVPSSSRP